jgi:hypothetical protein
MRKIFCTNIIYSFVLTSPWRWKFIDEKCRGIRVCGQLEILYKLCAYICVHKWIFTDYSDGFDALKDIALQY